MEKEKQTNKCDSPRHKPLLLTKEPEVIRLRPGIYRWRCKECGEFTVRFVVPVKIMYCIEKITE